MATRSSISIRNADGSYTGIYCHWDGYLSNNGRILEQHYADEAKIRQLMELGDISSLAPEIGERHPFDSPSIMNEAAYQAYKDSYGTWCKAYGRDRGESGTDARTEPTLDKLLERLGQEYDYVWEGNGWHVRFYHTNDGFVTLAEARRLEEEANKE